MPSSVIRFFDYRLGERQLDVLFLSGRRYVYHDVPAEVADTMRKASSKGEFFNRYVRGHFRFTRAS